MSGPSQDADQLVGVIPTGTDATIDWLDEVTDRSPRADQG
jgi:hypothetical protein